MTAKRVVILAAAAIVVILVVTGTYYFVLPHGPSTTVTIIFTGGPQEASLVFAPANFTVKEGQNVSLVVVNRSSASLQLQIPVLRVLTSVLRPGATTTVSFIPNTVGTFEVMLPCGTTPETCDAMSGYVTVLSP
jgi:hypothetical protein